MANFTLTKVDPYYYILNVSFFGVEDFKHGVYLNIKNICSLSGKQQNLKRFNSRLLLAILKLTAFIYPTSATLIMSSMVGLKIEAKNI